MATINLNKKGQSIILTKDTGTPNLRRVLIGLGWDPVEGGLFSRVSADWDLDASVICIDSNGRKEDLIYFSHRKHRSGAIIHDGDNLTGEGDGDDETIRINLNDIPQNVERLSFVINIFAASSRRQDFSKVKNCFVRVVDLDTNKELVRYDISGDKTYDGKTGLFIADMYRHKGEWKFKAIGEGVKVRDVHEMVDMKCNR